MRSTGTCIISATLLSLSPAIQHTLAREKQEVTLSYMIAPAQLPPEGLNRVAVLDAGVDSRGAGDLREAKWAKIAADMIEAMVQQGGQLYRPPLAVVNRRQMAQILQEKDFQVSGLVQGDVATRTGKLLDAQALITAQISIQIDEARAQKSSLNWGAILSEGLIELQGQPHDHREDPRGYRVAPQRRAVPRDDRRSADRRSAPVTRRRSSREIGERRSSPTEVRRYRVVPREDPRAGQRRSAYYRSYGRPAPPPSAPILAPDIPTREVEEIRRLLTVQCTFNMIDAVTGQTLLQYAPPPFHREDEASPDFFFGGLVEDTQLDPVDLFIGELVEQATTEFVGMIVPVNVAYSYQLIGHGDEGERAIRMLRAEDYETAFILLQESFRDDPDEEDTLFALGVVSEILGEPENALNHYRQLLAMEDLNDDDLQKYAEARNRLSAHMGRIMIPGSRVDRAPPEQPVPGE